MPLDERDSAYLWDMLEAAETIRSFVDGMTVAAFLDDRKTQLAIERAVEIIGEAARRISNDLKTAHPEVSWTKIVAQRNVIAHEYGEIKQDRMWTLATVHIPELIDQLRPLLPPLGATER